MFLVAHWFLWNYPKNASTLATACHLCERYSRGEPLWRWIEKIQSLKTIKIVWDDDPTTEIHCVSVDGVDFKIWEKKHPLLNQDKHMCSQKFKSAGLKYEIGLSIFESKCVWLAGPFRCGKHNKTIYRGEEDERNMTLCLKLGRLEP